MASGSTDLVNEAATNKISGEEERYSNTDLPVLQANVDGAMEVVSLLTPYLQTKDPSLLAQMAAERGRGQGDGHAQGDPRLRRHRLRRVLHRARRRSASSSPARSTRSPRTCPRSPAGQRDAAEAARRDASAGPSGRGRPGGPGSSRRRLLAAAVLARSPAASAVTSADQRRGRACRRGRRRQQPRPCRSTGRTRPASPPRPRTGWRSPRSTWHGTSQADLRDLLARWTAAAARMTAGQPVGEVTDAARAAGRHRRGRRSRPVSRLTITVGFGPALFDDRFGLAAAARRARRPAAAARRGPRPRLHRRRPVRPGLLRRPAGRLPRDPQPRPDRQGVVEQQWLQLGFGRTSTTTHRQPTPRNLLGFKDGTSNIKAEQTRLDGRYVWVGDETDQPWLRGGSYLVAPPDPDVHRELGPRLPADQENVIGRAKVSGAPLSGGTEFTAPDFTAADADGSPVIPARRAHPAGQPRATTAARGSCAAATPTPTASTRSTGTCSRGAVLHRLHEGPGAVRPAPDLARRPTRSTSTSATSAARSSPARLACPRPALGRHLFA